MKEIILQGEGYDNQKEWLLVTAEYRGDLYIVDEMQCLGSGSIYPTQFLGHSFSPDSEHIENVKIVSFDSKEKFEDFKSNLVLYKYKEK